MTEYMDEPTESTEDEARKPHPHSPGYGVTQKFPRDPRAPEAPSPASDAEDDGTVMRDHHGNVVDPFARDLGVGQ